MERSFAVSRVIVVGAGIAGMCAATRLARAGHHVEVYENSHRVGGKCHTEWIGDFAFDTGPTLLTLPAVFRDFFLKTGDPMESVLSLQPVDPSFDYRFSDGSSVQFSNLSRYETIRAIEKAFGTPSAEQWARLMTHASDIWDVSRVRFIESELTSLLSLLKTPTLINDLKVITPWKSLHSLVSSKSDDYRLRYIIDRYATYSGSDPRHAPAALLSIAYVEEAFGAWHIAGGIGELAIAIYNRAIENGVRFHLNSKVIRIDHDGRHVSGITLEDRTKVTSEIVIANVDASSLYTSLLADDEPLLWKPRKLLKKSKPSLAGFSILLGMREDSNNKELEHHTVLFPSDYREEFTSIFEKAQPPEHPAIYICAPKDPLMRKRTDRRNWSILINAPRHSHESDGWNWSDSEFTRKYGEKIIDQIEERGIAIRNRMEFCQFRTPADFEKETLAPGGSIYGTADRPLQRTRNRSPIAGLFCVGGSTHPGGGLPLVAISAEIVANAIGRA